MKTENTFSGQLKVELDPAEGNLLEDKLERQVISEFHEEMMKRKKEEEEKGKTIHFRGIDIGMLNDEDARMWQLIEHDWQLGQPYLSAYAMEADRSNNKDRYEFAAYLGNLAMRHQYEEMILSEQI